MHLEWSCERWREACSNRSFVGVFVGDTFGDNMCGSAFLSSFNVAPETCVNHSTGGSFRPSFIATTTHAATTSAVLNNPPTTTPASQQTFPPSSTNFNVTTSNRSSGSGSACSHFLLFTQVIDRFLLRSRLPQAGPCWFPVDCDSTTARA
jgi:hypothetical protein